MYISIYLHPMYIIEENVLSFTYRQLTNAADKSADPGPAFHRLNSPPLRLLSCQCGVEGGKSKEEKKKKR